MHDSRVSLLEYEHHHVDEYLEAVGVDSFCVE